MKTDDILTLKAVLLYILKHCPDFMRHSVYYIVKSAYIAQQMHLVRYMCPIYYDTIKAFDLGPVPSDIYDMLKIVRGDSGTANFHRNDNLAGMAQESVSFHNEAFIPNEEPDMDYLSPSAVECLDDAIEQVSGMTFNEIIEATHDREWERAHNTQSRIMNLANIARDGGANDASVGYLKGVLECDALSR